MRPTRWTRKRRITKRGKGGWNVGWYGIQYTNPVTGNGVATDWRGAHNILKMRREQERDKVSIPNVKGVTWEP